jgi:hypothetical protein
VGLTAAPKAARCFSDLETRVTAERVTEAAAVVMQAAIVSGEVRVRTAGECGNDPRSRRGSDLSTNEAYIRSDACPERDSERPRKKTNAHRPKGEKTDETGIPTIKRDVSKVNISGVSR